MKIEEGTIISIKEKGTAEIKVGRHSDCIACGACEGAENIVVTAVDPLGVKVGQHVKFEFRDVNIVIGAFICFVMPLLVCRRRLCRSFPGPGPGLRYSPDGCHRRHHRLPHRRRRRQTLRPFPVESRKFQTEDHRNLFRRELVYKGFVCRGRRVGDPLGIWTILLANWLGNKIVHITERAPHVATLQ